ncbi:MAG: S41 family peptidase, partial [Ilumatobacteraceae bacterium]
RGAAATVKPGQWLDSAFQDNVSAKVVKTPHGKFGYLRLWSFDLADDVGFVDEVARLLEALPDDGLIVDLRGNPGGLIWAAERLLQLLGPGPGPIEPTKFSLLATPLTREMAKATQNEDELQPWRESLEEAVANGEPYSQAVPITPPDRCNDIGQVYGGPVVAVVDPNTYSAGDLFAAGFFDNGLGTLVTVGEATGAGGANVWMPEQVQDALLGTRYELATLPDGIGYSISVRRATRAGGSDGLVIEDVGVRGHQTYAMTKDDLVDNNCDLLSFCAKTLASQPTTALRVTAVGDASVVVATSGLDRLDVYVDDRPQGWLPIDTTEKSGSAETTVTVPDDWSTIELKGFAGEQLRQRRHVHRSDER